MYASFLKIRAPCTCLPRAGLELSTVPSILMTSYEAIKNAGDGKSWGSLRREDPALWFQGQGCLALQG